MSAPLRRIPLQERVIKARAQLEAIRSSDCPKWLVRKYEDNLYKMEKRLALKQEEK